MCAAAGEGKHLRRRGGGGSGGKGSGCLRFQGLGIQQVEGGSCPARGEEWMDAGIRTCARVWGGVGIGLRAGLCGSMSHAA